MSVMAWNCHALIASVKVAISKIAANNHDRCKAFHRDYNKMVLNLTVILYE